MRKCSLTKDHISTYFICFTMVLLPDSPAPERKPDFEFAQKHEINISDNFRLMKNTGPRGNSGNAFYQKNY